MKKKGVSKLRVRRRLMAWQEEAHGTMEAHLLMRGFERVREHFAKEKHTRYKNYVQQPNKTKVLIMVDSYFTITGLISGRYVISIEGMNKDTFGNQETCLRKLDFLIDRVRRGDSMEVITSEPLR